MANNQRTTTTQGDCTYGYPAEPYYVVLPPAPIDPWKRRRRVLGYGALLIAIVLLMVAAVYFLWPSEPQMQVARVQLIQFGFYTLPPQPGSLIPRLFLNISMPMTVQVNNMDFYAVEYDSVNMGLGYRGRAIGSVSSESGKVSARSTSYVNATLDLDGVEVFHDVVYLIRDIKKGEIPFDTLTEFDGRIRVWLFKITLQKIASCGVVINPSNQTIISQDCELEAIFRPSSEQKLKKRLYVNQSN